MKYITTVGDEQYTIEITDDDQLIVNGQAMSVDFETIRGQPVYSLLSDGDSHEAYVYQADGHWEVLLNGDLFEITVVDEREQRLRSQSGGGAQQTGKFNLKAPMPGLVVAIPVEKDQEVKKGDVLVILESMKMQNELRAPRDGKIEAIRVKPGESVEQRQTMLIVG
jgi:biotin carboxyl carrier protein